MLTAAAIGSAEILHFQPESIRAARIFAALTLGASKAHITVRASDRYAGASDLLMLWGPGAPDRFQPMAAHCASGRHVIALDLAYWDRDLTFRVSIDAAHPQAWIMRRAWPADRLRRAGVQTANAWHPSGPVIIAGIGEKAMTQYGSSAVHAWERQMIEAAKKAGRRVIYRPKKQQSCPFSVPTIAYSIPIERALSGASAVVTWHSNVAVDAIRLGIPAICRDGAAAAVCPSAWAPDLSPLPPETRDRFLANLAWFQWAPAEAAAMWTWLRETLS